jgi:hypothetical protein
MFEGLSVLYFPVSCGLPLPADGVERFPTQCSPPRFAAEIGVCHRAIYDQPQIFRINSTFIIQALH